MLVRLLQLFASTLDGGVSALVLEKVLYLKIFGKSERSHAQAMVPTHLDVLERLGVALVFEGDDCISSRRETGRKHEMTFINVIA